MPADPPLILIVDDEPQICRFLRASLGSHNYRLAEASTGRQALTAAATQPPDLVILDLGLPDMDGLEVVRQLRDWSAVPIVVLSARGQEKDKVAALDLGADDYLTKPFSVGELLARIRVALRHAATRGKEDAAAVFTVGELKVDLAARRERRGRQGHAAAAGDDAVHLAATIHTDGFLVGEQPAALIQGDGVVSIVAHNGDAAEQVAGEPQCRGAADLDLQDTAVTWRERKANAVGRDVADDVERVGVHARDDGALS